MRYMTNEGRIVSHRSVNKHHTLWEASKYTTGEERLFRNAGGLVVPLLVSVHADLHADLLPPIKPHKQVRERIYHYSQAIEGDVYERFRQITEFVGKIAFSSENNMHAEQAYNVYESLTKQSAYIEQGKVELYV